MSACACMGPQGSDPVCPCRMKSGDIPGQQWVRFAELEIDLPTDAQVADQDELFGVKHPEGE